MEPDNKDQASYPVPAAPENINAYALLYYIPKRKAKK